jgi:DNA-binding PadR family transcriptional regulator
MAVTDMIVLGFLNIKPMYGYEIIKFARDVGLDEWGGIKMASIYKALGRLELKGMISAEEISEGNNPTKRVFSSNKNGITLFRELMKKELSDLSKSSVEFYVALSFLYKGVTKQFFEEILDKRINKCNNHLKEHRKGCVKETPFYGIILHDTGTKHMEIELETLMRLKESIKNPKNSDIFLKYEDEPQVKGIIC